MIWFFHLNLLSTSKPCHIWCFTNLQIILVFAITYFTILFIQKLHFVLFLFLILILHVGSFLHSFFFATSFTVGCYGLIYLLWMSFTVFDVNGWCAGKQFCFCWSHSYNVNTWTWKSPFPYSSSFSKSWLASVLGLHLFSFLRYSSELLHVFLF